MMSRSRQTRWTAQAILWLGALMGLWSVGTPGWAQSSGNRLAYLDDFLDPYYVHRDFPILTTPQWAGDPEVEAVVVLAIDDMRDSEPYERYLRPILDRLQQIDGRAAVSIMANRVDPNDPQLQTWLAEGLSLEAHTWDHPCPCLADSQFRTALETYQKCVDALAAIPNHRPVAFRMPCCDSMNTPSPRFYAEIFNRPTPAGNFLTMDSSVFQVFTAADPSLPMDAVLRPDGQPRFERYVPFPNYVNKIENYPYPYLIGRTCWQFPCMVPSDWEAQHLQAPNNPETVEDLKVALDLTVLKQGVFGLVFHPHGWIRNDQVIELIDHAVARHGRKVKFMTFAEVHQRMEQFLLGGQPLRAADGGDHGVRLLDLNHDGFLDLVIANADVQVTRIWRPELRAWQDTSFPVALMDSPPTPPAPTPSALAGRAANAATGQRSARGRFGITSHGRVLLLADGETTLQAWEFDGRDWQLAPQWLNGLSDDLSQPLRVQAEGRDLGLRLRDLNGDGQAELVIASTQRQLIKRWDGEQWRTVDYQLPPEVALVDEWGRDAGARFIDFDGDGLEDILFSNEQGASLHLAVVGEDDQFLGWPRVAHRSQRGDPHAIPPLVRDVPVGGPLNNGVWFAGRTMWVQNEDTAILPDKVDQRSFDDLLGDLAAIPPPRSPQRSLQAMRTRAELQIDLVAHEPLVMDPIAMDWGPDGRLWMVEMRDYPLGMDGRGQPGGRIRVLEDTNRDGRYDQATIFLDGIPFPTGVKVWKKGILVTAAPEIFYAEDTTGDGRADHREVLYRGFAEGNQQHRVNGLEWGLDHWLHVANGDSGGVVRSLRTGKEVPIGGRDLRIQPDSGELEAESGMTQYGRVRDDWGNWFGCNNTYPIWHYVLSDVDLRRNPHFVPRDIRKHVSETPGAAPVFPTSRTLPRFNDFHMANRFTSACGITIYRDRELGSEFAGNSFVCEPVHNLVQREVMVPRGASFQSRRADDEQDREFLSSEDHWFRPVMARTGPDGALWIADMYRLVIEHPEWIPAEWQARLNLRAGDSRGRIYRVHRSGQSPGPLPRLDLMGDLQWVSLLSHDNGWIRDMAHQLLLWESPSVEARDALLRTVSEGTSPLGRLHAMSVLDALGDLPPEKLAGLIGDPHPGVRRQALRIAAARIDQQPAWKLAIGEQLSTESDVAVVLQAAILIGHSRDKRFVGQVAAGVTRFATDPYVATALISSLNAENVETILETLLTHWPAELLGSDTSELTTVFNAGLKFVSATNDRGRLQLLFEGLIGGSTPSSGVGLTDQLQRHQLIRPSQTWRWTAMAELLEGLSANQREELPESVLAHFRELGHMIDTALADPNVDLELQSAAVRLLAQDFLSPEQARQRLGQRLLPQVPPSIQSAAVRGLTRYDDEAIADDLLQDWGSHSPGLRSEIMDAIFSRNEWIKRLLIAIQEQRFSVVFLDASRRQQLLQHRSASVRKLANEVLAAAGPSNKQALIDQYLGVRAEQADTARGEAVFRQHCAGCHRLNGWGHPVGPDLAAFVDKSDVGLLTAILDPNRAVEDRYLEYLALGLDGRQYRGLIGHETSTSLVLVGQDNKPVELLRSELEQLAATGFSLMPEGLEKDISVAAMADLLQYLRSTESPPKEFPGNQPDYPFVRDDGSLRLLATNSRIYGPSLVFESQYRNLGFWGHSEDRAVWTIRVPQPGRYGITLDYACADEAAGNRFVLQVAGQTVGGRVGGTGSWDHYEWKDIGFVELEAGEYELVFRSAGTLNGYLLDLRGIVLWPE